MMWDVGLVPTGRFGCVRWEPAYAIDKSSLVKEDGQPECGLVRSGPLNSVATVCGNENVIARFHGGDFTIVKAEFGFAPKDDHPLGLLLVVPGPRFRFVTGGNYPFNANRLSLGQDVDQFRWQVAWNVVEQVHGSGTMKRDRNGRELGRSCASCDCGAHSS